MKMTQQKAESATISEVISKLVELQEKYGDLPCCCTADNGYTVRFVKPRLRFLMKKPYPDGSYRCWNPGKSYSMRGTPIIRM